MEPLYFRVPRLNDHTIRIEHWDLPRFFDPVHYHEDSQITLVLEGHGTLLAGHHIHPFKPGDVLLFGKDLPHVLRNEILPNHSASEINARAISIFFNETVFSVFTRQLPELQMLSQLIDAMNFGLKISGIQIDELVSIAEASEKNRDAERILHFMTLLHRLASAPSITKLSATETYFNKKKNHRGLNLVFEYMLDNYQNPITLDDMAKLCNMAPTAFCRFFKNSTKKTFSRFLIEIRIDKVCKQIAEGQDNFTEAYLMCGFNNSSNFYRHFKTVMGMSPGEYVKHLEIQK